MEREESADHPFFDTVKFVPLYGETFVQRCCLSWCSPLETNSLCYIVVHLEKKNDKSFKR